MDTTDFSWMYQLIAWLGDVLSVGWTVMKTVPDASAEDVERFVAMWGVAVSNGWALLVVIITGLVAVFSPAEEEIDMAEQRRQDIDSVLRAAALGANDILAERNATELRRRHAVRGSE